ncbi:MAG: O-antigen ligase family protein [Lautropia sp.]|nr:O-antigen ligase family protein [Lautropia sp.]
MKTPDITLSPSYLPWNQDPLNGRLFWLFWVLLFFFITYFETWDVYGIKYAVIWRALVMGPAIFVIISRPLPPGARLLSPLFWGWLAFACAPLWGIGLGISDAEYSIELAMNRMFVPIMLMALLALQRYDVADLCVRALPLFLCLVSIPLLAGWLPPVGLQFSLSAVSGIDLTAYNSVFQNQHSASLAHAIAGIAAFTLAARFPGRPSIFYLVLGLLCFVLTALTTARSGLLGLILGVFVVATFKHKLKLLLAPALLVAFILGVSALVKPELIQMISNRITGQTLYTKGPSADTLTSGRLTLQKAAWDSWVDAEPLTKLFGAGREGSKTEIGLRTGEHNVAHSAFLDELLAFGLVGFLSLMAMLTMAYRLAWRNAWAGYPAGLAMLVGITAYGMLQAMDYSFQNLFIGMVLILETRAASMKQAMMDMALAGHQASTPRLVTHA